MDPSMILALAAEVICSTRTVRRWLEDPVRGVSPNMRARLERAARKLGYDQQRQAA